MTTTTAARPPRTLAGDGRRVPRALHPLAWWIWAVGIAVAVNRTNNPLLLLLALVVLAFVVANRRTEAPWARAFKYYLYLGLSVIVLRIVFRVIFGSGITPQDHILFHLPHIPTPHWYAGISIGGPVSLEATLSAATDGLRLATMLCCIGAANALANPKRALRLLPGALYEVGMAVVVSVTVAPQLVESAQRVARARRLRAGRTSGLRALRSIAVPVLEDAMERSLKLAAAMDSRGYGRKGTATPASRRITGLLMISGLLGICVGIYGLLDPSAPSYLGLIAIITGAVLCVLGLLLGSQRVTRTQYRPDPFSWPECVVVLCGIASAALLYVSAHYDPALINPGYYPLRFPPLPVLPTVAILLAGVAAFAAPPPARRPPTKPTRTSAPVEPAREKVPA